MWMRPYFPPPLNINVYCQATYDPLQIGTCVPTGEHKKRNANIATNDTPRPQPVVPETDCLAKETTAFTKYEKGKGIM
jgi:hypothetical protein